MGGYIGAAGGTEMGPGLSEASKPRMRVFFAGEADSRGLVAAQEAAR